MTKKENKPSPERGTSLTKRLAANPTGPKPKAMEPEYKLVRRAAVQEALSLGSVRRIKVCRLTEMDAWWVTLFVDADDKIDLKQYVWNSDQDRLEPILVLKRIPLRRLESAVRKVESDRSCDVLTPAKEDSRPDWTRVMIHKLTARGRLKKIGRMSINRAHGRVARKPESSVGDKSAPKPKHRSLPASKESLSPDEKEKILSTIRQWKTAWENADLDLLWQTYHPDFRARGLDRDRFLESKKRYFLKYSTIRVELARMKMKKRGDTVVVDALRVFRGDDHVEKKWKRFLLKPTEKGDYAIFREMWLAQ